MRDIKNNEGNNISEDEPVFPLITFDPKTKEWKCLGTGFFINIEGLFITANHVFRDTSGKHVPTLYGVQTTRQREKYIRVLRFFVPHPNADIGIGLLGSRRLKEKNINPEPSSYFKLDFTPLSIGDNISTFAFPKTLTQFDELDNSYEFTFTGYWQDGAVTDLHENGFSLLKNKCYQTTINIKDGASGGPVIRENKVVGVNSSGIDVQENEEPISFITPVELLKEVVIKINNREFKITDLIP